MYRGLYFASDIAREKSPDTLESSALGNKSADTRQRVDFLAKLHGFDGLSNHNSYQNIVQVHI
jgi:hypothetical protein